MEEVERLVFCPTGSDLTTPVPRHHQPRKGYTMTSLIATQKLEELKLKVKHLSEYLDQAEIDDGYIDDPAFNSIVHDIEELHDTITP